MSLKNEPVSLIRQNQPTMKHGTKLIGVSKAHNGPTIEREQRGIRDGGNTNHFKINGQIVGS